nr:Gag-Pol polyprotein [Tanacetum cinerariifolium]
MEALVVTKGRSMEPKSKTRKKKNNFKCFKCGKQRHFKKDCRGPNTSNPQGNVASTSDDGNALCCEAAVVNEGRKRFADVWLFDVGATFDITARREWFHQYKPISEGEKVATNLYQLKGEILEEEEASVASHSPTHRVAITWHQKLRHMSEQGMKILLERIGSDVWQALVQSLGGEKYFVSFIDDYSKRCYVYPIKKSNVFDVFKDYKTLVELDSGTKIKCLRTDNDGEYAERMKRTLLERARTMLATASLGKSFWAEAVNIAYYVINRSLSTTVDLKTPMEMWTRKPVKYSDLYIFGSSMYVMYNSQETTKLDSKSKKCLFLRYVDRVKAYHLWDPAAHKVIVNRDVVLVEDKIQENEKGDSTTKETTSIQMGKEFMSNDSSKVVPQHEVNETTGSQGKKRGWRCLEYRMHQRGKFNVRDDTRPGIAHALRVVSRYVDSDYACDLDGSKSTTGYVFTLSGEIVSWVSKLQSVVAMSITEYVAATQASKEAVWLKILLKELGYKQKKITLFCDKQRTLDMKEGTLDMQNIHTNDNVADYLMKSINGDKFIWCRSSCGLAETMSEMNGLNVVKRPRRSSHLLSFLRSSDGFAISCSVTHMASEETTSQMHNNIMAAGSKDRPPMLEPGRYPQWHLRFLRYVDTRTNGEALWKCILSGPYKPTTVLVHAVEATDDSPAVPEHTTYDELKADVVIRIILDEYPYIVVEISSDR